MLAANARQERIIDSLLTLAQGQRGLDQREPIDLEAVAGDVRFGDDRTGKRAGLGLAIGRPSPRRTGPC